MANMDLTPEPGGNGTNPASENGAVKPADPRVKELELEVARLRSELGELQKKYEIEHKFLNARIVAELPKTEEEFLKLAREGRPLKDLLNELIQEYGLEEMVKSYFLEGMPKNEEELREFIANPRPFRKLVEEVEEELGLEQKP